MSQVVLGWKRILVYNRTAGLPVEDVSVRSCERMQARRASMDIENFVKGHIVHAWHCEAKFDVPDDMYAA